ncbi:MAG: NUDIX hydrolase [uncultured bacterium]|nr:MAG: NUDIX hydrolase [uncultured bacterium]KKT89205.1 MAG: NUDIX hydrolase [Candidatus Moranbacteria bacterium GW2011_GWC2_45_10]KKT95507.1 MAG: NUDIX hydrolase [Parcubacteria group bacterium GW2011_GWC1_45_14]HAV11329.1 hypothetical protein [Candidatus Moranbacteria bacterium]
MLIRKAGAIILSSDSSDKVGLIYRTKQKDWSFPKGHIESEESSFEAMIREVVEESGLKVKLLQELPDMNYVDSQGNEVLISMYLVKSMDDNNTFGKSGDDVVEWVKIEEVSEILTYENLKKYYREILPIIFSYKSVQE